MEAERYKKVDELFDAVLEMEPAARAAYLNRVCAGDPDLRREVESLLAAYDDAGDFIATPAFEVVAESLAAEGVAEETVTETAGGQASLIGERIVHYEVLSMLGAGGMGEVYLARDTRLGRHIALKILPTRFTQDSNRVSRFQRESRAASALNHPNIITIYEIGQHQGVHFIASEFIEGDTLRLRIERGPLHLKVAVDIALQTASALSAAHTAGIVHRDIKPENVMIRRDGYVKVLDFDLAKLTESLHDKSDSHKTLSTQTGAVMGTINYMSPEQALGHEVDQRTDIFSFGIVLYEMITGQQPFKGLTQASTFNAILNKKPLPITDFITEASPQLERIIDRLLEKDRDLRYQTASDIRAELKRLQINLDSGTTVADAEKAVINTARKEKTRDTGRFKKFAWGFVVAALLLTSGWAMRSLYVAVFGKSEAPNWLKTHASKQTTGAGVEYFPSLSPDGKLLIFASRVSGNWEIYAKRVGSKKIDNLTADEADDTQPAFSPDGSRIAFSSTRNGGGLFVMSVTGESVRQVKNFGSNPSWSPNGKEIVCADTSVESFGRNSINSRLWIIEAETGNSRVLTEEDDAVNPNWSPHGDRIAFWGLRKGRRDIFTVAAGGGEPLAVTNDEFSDWNPVWSPDGRYIYFASDRSGTMAIWRVSVNERSGATTDAPELVPTPSTYSQHLCFSRDGKHLAFVDYQLAQNAVKLPFDPATERITGERVFLTQGSSLVFVPNVSRDGEWLAYQDGHLQREICVLKIGSQIPNQLTDDNQSSIYPAWSPDGKRIAFCTRRSGSTNIWMVNPDGSNLRQITEVKPMRALRPTWSPDGQQLAYSVFEGRTFIIDINKPFSEQQPREIVYDKDPNLHFSIYDWSPDGKLLSGHLQNEEGPLNGIYTYSFETRQFEKVSDIGQRSVWLADSRRLIFPLEGKLYIVDRLTKTPRELTSFVPNVAGLPTLPTDNRAIYLAVATTEADIWVLTLE